MKKRTSLLTVCLAVLLAFACKKEDHTPPFSPVGYWKGNVYLYNSYLLNRADGSSRFYWRVQGSDTTAEMAFKLDGRYTMRGNTLHAFYLYPGSTSDSLLLETYHLSPELISGTIVSTLTGEAIPFELRRQP
jgi:hypothetical protein